jgi:hypothetical protein
MGAEFILPGYDVLRGLVDRFSWACGRRACATGARAARRSPGRGRRLHEALEAVARAPAERPRDAAPLSAAALLHRLDILVASKSCRSCAPTVSIYRPSGLAFGSLTILARLFRPHTSRAKQAAVRPGQSPSTRASAPAARRRSVLLPRRSPRVGHGAPGSMNAVPARGNRHVVRSLNSQPVGWNSRTPRAATNDEPRQYVANDAAMHLVLGSRGLRDVDHSQAVWSGARKSRRTRPST